MSDLHELSKITALATLLALIGYEWLSLLHALILGFGVLWLLLARRG